jgi:hypothetical protein
VTTVTSVTSVPVSGTVSQYHRRGDHSDGCDSRGRRGRWAAINDGLAAAAVKVAVMVAVPQTTATATFAAGDSDRCFCVMSAHAGQAGEFESGSVS